MAKTNEEKIAYMREWRLKNKEKIKSKKYEQYHKNINGYRDTAKIRSKNYYERAGREIFINKYHTDEEFKNKQKNNSLNRLKKRKELLYFLRIKMGGECTECGYDEEPSILQFHHHEKNKTDNVTNLQTLEKMEKEALKCILLCPNCHALHHLTTEHA